MMFGEHAFFILASYGVSVLVLGGLALWTVLDGRSVRARLNDLDARGVKRRSAWQD